MPEQISLLRQRMIDDMSLRNMSALTQAAYIRAVKNFSKHFGKSPDKLTFEDVRQYQLSLVGRGLGPQAVNQIMCALRFFYKTTMGIKDARDHIALARRSDPLPAILSREEVGRFLQAAHSVKYRTAFATIYGVEVHPDADLHVRPEVPASCFRLLLLPLMFSRIRAQAAWFDMHQSAPAGALAAGWIITTLLYKLPSHIGWSRSCHFFSCCRGRRLQTASTRQ
jgi:hypothetical protein